MASESGFSNQKKLGTAQFKTIHNVGGDKFGQSVASKALYEKTPEAVITVTEVLGNSGQIEFLNVNFPFHVADVNDILRMSTGTTKANFEFDILSIVDGDNFLILPIVEASQIDSNNASIMSWVTNKANSDGSQIVTLAPVPLQFVKDSATIDVNEDTVTPANNVALPTGMFIYVDGVQVPISVDTGTPANTVGVPVIVTGVAGPINITAGDLNVQLSDQGVNADVTRIGDGTTQLAITVTGEATVHDADVLAKLIDIETVLPVALGQQASVDSLAVVLSTEQEGFLSNMDGYLANLQQAVSSDGGVIPPFAMLMGGKNGVVFKGLSMGASGEANVIVTSAALPTGAATEAKQDTGNTSLSSIDGKLQDNGVVDAGNSSVIPLGISGVFTGTAFEVTKYAAINVNVRSDVASATNGLKVEFSPDGINWDHSHQTTYTGGNGVGYIFNAEYKFARVVYTNSAVSQTSFRLQTIFKTTLTTSSLYTLSQTVNANMFAALNRSVISGETTGGGGGYVNVKVNPSGALTVEADVTGTVSVSNFPATQNTLPQTDTGSITSTQKSVGTSAVRATVSGSSPSSVRKRLLIKPSKNNTGAIYLGSSSVTTANGLEIIGPDRLEFLLDAADYFLISDTAGQVVEIVEVA